MSENVNTTTNGTQSSSCFNPTAKQIGITFACCLIFIVSLTGNTVIGIIVYKTQSMRKPITFFIVNMAMSDLLIPIFVIPRGVQMHYIDSWLISGPLGQVLCKLVDFLIEVSAAVSIQSLILIAVDRFGAVVFPLRSPLISSKLCPFFILATWIVAISVYSPELLVLKLVEYPAENLVCERHWNEGFGESSSYESYFLSCMVVFVFIPLVLIAILYLIIYLNLKSQKIPGEVSANAAQQRQQRERNVLKMAIAILLGFAMCWLPFAIWTILVYFTDTIIRPNCAFLYFSFVVHFMAVANCTINPCICFIFSRNYRKEVKALLR